MIEVDKASSKILVVDDEFNNRLLLREALEAEGYLVGEAENGPDALALMAVDLPDVVLLDIMMPGMSGLEVCQRLKSDSRTAPVPVIIVTAQRERADKLSGIAAGASDFLTKPLDLMELRLRVKNAANAKSFYDEAQNRYSEVLQLEKTRDELVHMIVHDLRTPLTAIHGHLQLAEMVVKRRVDEEIGESISEASENTRRLITMVNSMLDVSRLEAGKMPLNRTPTDLCELVLDVRATLGDRLDRVSVEPDETSEVTNISCDRDVMRRVIENLVGNALDYSPQEKPVSVVVCRANGNVRLSVSDQGPGVPEDCRELIFEKFGQVSSTKKVRKASTGLGLAFCKMAVEAHSGRIGLESQVDEGSTFWFELPVS